MHENNINNEFQSNMKRRTCIRLIGGGLLVSSGAISGCYNSHILKNEIQKSNDMLDADPRYRWLNDAARAPSAHNMQPWAVDLHESPDVILLFADQKRFLINIDPENRQSMISLGAFLELICISAQSDNYNSHVVLFPQGDSLTLPVAKIKFTLNKQQKKKDDLYPYINKRHTNRGVYRPIPSLTNEHLSVLKNMVCDKSILINGTIQPELISSISDLAKKSWFAELNNQTLMLETLKVTRVGKSEITSFRDGIAVQGVLPELAASIGLFPRNQAPKKKSMAMKKMQTLGENQAESATGWIWLTSKSNTYSQQINAGRTFMRLHLLATQYEIALHPMSQALEPYAPYYEMLYQTLGIQNKEHTIQMLARLGYATPESPSIRRHVHSFIKDQ